MSDLRTGRYLLQVVEHQGRWLALLDWGASAHKLSDRDEWIDWTSQQRAERQGLVALNRRFLILSQKRMPNLAFRALALACQNLSEQWKIKYGYAPELAETFTDIEQFEGTCYKAAGWLPCGKATGFERHLADYYREHGKLKKHWVKPLNRNARVILTGIDVPVKYQAGLNLQKREGEQTVARKLYSQSNLTAAVITADNLHNSQPDAQAILDTGADYVLQIKQENRHSYKAAE